MARNRIRRALRRQACGRNVLRGACTCQREAPGSSDPHVTLAGRNRLWVWIRIGDDHSSHVPFALEAQDQEWFLVGIFIALTIEGFRLSSEEIVALSGFAWQMRGSYCQNRLQIQLFVIR